ncbi:MAG: reverse transcriptase domain-containing protein [Clostridia bacterium]|nr:reverse transcriptase domain-containing protein [Clostridia bacterium]
MFDVLPDRRFREKFLEETTAYKPDDDKTRALKDYILSDDFSADVERLRRGDYFPAPPCLKEVTKDPTGAKRKLYVFRGKDHFLLSFMHYALVHLYDPVFSDGLYSFRVHKNRRAMIGRIHEEMKDSADRPYFVFRTDIRSFGLSRDQDILIRKLSGIMGHDPELLDFLTRLLRRNQYQLNGQIVDGYLSAIPGCPLADFFSNVYLMDVDAYFQENSDLYCRFSDDILVLSRDPRKLNAQLIKLRDMARENKLELSSVKTELFAPNEPVDILGFRFEGPHIDLSRDYMETGCRLLRINAKKAEREARQSGLSREEAARRFIANSLWPFMKSEAGEDRFYARQFFPVITRDNSLREIDHQVQHCARYILTGKWGKAQYRATYKKLKSLGYVSIVHLYHNGYKDL